MKPIKTGLGRGLDALISINDTEKALTQDTAPSSINEVEVELIHANPSQPRQPASHLSTPAHSAFAPATPK